MQAHFVSTFPFERLKDRLSATELRTTITEISARRTARFIGMLTLFLYWQHIAPKGGKEAPPEEISSLLCAIQEYFSSVRDRMHRRRALLMNALPVWFLSIRMAVESLVHAAFPKWWTTSDCAETMLNVDRMIEQLFDPNAYHSHITSLESSAEAIRLAAREGLGLKARSKAARYYTTSTLVAAALPKAPIVIAHRHAAGDSLPAINTVLSQFATPKTKQQLYQAAVSSVHAEGSKGSPISPARSRSHAGGANDAFRFAQGSGGAGSSPLRTAAFASPTSVSKQRPSPGS